MSGLDFAFDHPSYLVLLLLIPLIWVWSFRSLSGLGRARRIFALLLRTAVLTLLVLSLANMQFLRTMEKMTVVYLLDQSDSIPAAQREAMIEYVVEDVRKHRNESREDRASVIIFGRAANIEVPPLDDDLPLFGRLESIVDLRTDATNLAAAMKLARATFPEDSARRIVVVTDGNENMGDSRALAQLLAEDGVGIDVVPIRLAAQSEVAVERISLPSDIRTGQPFEAKVVVNHVVSPDRPSPQPVSGTIRLTRRMGHQLETLAEEKVQLGPGKRVYRFTHEIDAPDFYEYRATFIPDDSRDDRVAKNNRATAFTHVSGKGHVLLIEDFENRDPSGQGEFQTLVDRLRAMDIEVTVQFTDALFTSLAELQRFDCVILANVPRASGPDAETMVNFSDAQIRMLVRNTEETGCGLIMMGGPNSFGAGGWANTELEKAMPVDFQIHNVKVKAVGALVMVMHASEMANGNHWQKVIAREALKALGPQDYCGVVHWGRSGETWLWGAPVGLMPVAGNRKQMIARLSRMTPGDMPDFDPSMRMAAAAFANLQQAAVKHMIIISDGDPTPPSRSTINSLIKVGAKVSTVAVGAHGQTGSSRLQSVANDTGGKYYVATDPRVLPRIYQNEARKVARPLVREERVQPQIKAGHQILQGIDGPPPPITGFVLTTLKENPLVEVQLVSPDPPDQRNATILASWQYRLGRTVALTTDAGNRWATEWTGWEGYDQLFTQMVRWAMRPSGDTGKFTVATEQREGKVRVIVTAMDKDDEFLNFLDMAGSVVGPDMEPLDVAFPQTAPGRYVGEFVGEEAGSYFLTIVPGPNRAPIRTGINVPYSSEYQDRATNDALLETLVNMEPKGGRPGKTISGSGTLERGDLDEWLETDTFRHDLAKAVSSDYVWPMLLVVAGCVFFADVFVRRVAVSFEWVLPWWGRMRDVILRREVAVEPDERLQRLRSRKEEISDQIDQRRAATRFEPVLDEDVDAETLTEAGTERPPDASTRTRPKTEITPDAETEDDYTTRLLKAKKQVWKDDPRRERP